MIFKVAMATVQGIGGVVVLAIVFGVPILAIIDYLN